MKKKYWCPMRMVAWPPEAHVRRVHYPGSGRPGSGGA